MKRSIVLLLALTVALTLAAVPVSAGPTIPAGGDWTYLPEVTEIRTAGPNMFIYGTDTGDWTGTFSGTSEEEFVVVCHRNAGFSFYKGEMTFTGTVEDEAGAFRSGSMVIKTNGKQGAVADDCGPVFDTDWHGHWVIIGGTGDLADIHGHGTFEGPSLSLTYEGQIHFS